MIECKKRQKIITNGNLSYRCINKQSDLYGQAVNDICHDCPLNSLNGKDWGGVCPRRRIINDNIAFCHGTNREVTRQECNACLLELSSYNLNPEKIIPEYKANEKIIEKNKDYPSLFNQANNYRLAVTRWIKAGRPKRTDEEIRNIFENICSKCDWYDIKTSRCKGCGCRVVPKGLALVNKLKMATEHCPKKLF